MSRRTTWILALLGLVATAAVAEAVALANPLDDRFTYSGTLEAPASLFFGNGVCDLEFALHDAAAGGAQVGASEVVEDVPVIDFAYRVTLNATGLFGPNAFKGDERYMAVGTRCTPGDQPGPPPATGPFTPQPSRARLVTVPFALWAQDAGVDLSGEWHLLGNAGTDPAVHFVGTTDGMPLVLRTAGTERMRIAVPGQVGIGTNSPSSNLHVAGAGGVDLKVEGAQPSVTLDRAGTAGLGQLGFVTDGDDLRLVNFLGGASLVLAADGSVCLGSGC